MSQKLDGLDWFLTAAAGTNGLTVQADVNASTGGFMSATKVDTAFVFNNLWDTVDRNKCTVGITDHRVVVLANLSDQAYGPAEMIMLYQVPEGIAWSFALDTAGVVPISQGGPVAVATSAGLTYTAPTSTPGLAVPAIPIGSCIGVHIQRNVPPNTPEVVSDGCTIDVVVPQP